MTIRAVLRAITSPAQRRRLWAVAAVSFLAGVADAVCLLAVSTAAVTITRGEQQIDLLGVRLPVRNGLLLAAVAAGARLLLGLWSARASAAVAAGIVQHHRTTVLRRFVDAPWVVSAAQSPGAIQQVALTNSQVAGAFAITATSVVGSVINLAVLAAAAIATSAAGAGAVTALAIVVAVAMRPWTRKARHVGEIEAQRGQDVAARFSEIVATARPIALFHVGKPIADRFTAASRDQVAFYRTSRFLAGASPAVFQAMVAIAATGALWAMSGRTLDNVAAFGGVALLSLRAVSHGQIAQQAVQTLGAQQGFIRQLLSIETQLAPAAGGIGSKEAPHIDSLALDAVTLRHDDRFTLGPIDLDICRHEVVGIVGQSGAGKSTVIDLLARLRTPTTGSLMANGVSADQFSPSSWAARIACVPQEPVLLSGTVADNIRWFRDVDATQVEAATHMANIADEIAGWPQGLATEVGPGGAQLSVGQRQRICLARALAGQPDVLLLDEATSALDAASEERIRTALHSLKGSMTMVIVAHRPSTLSLCDRLVRIEGNGRLRPGE